MSLGSTRVPEGRGPRRENASSSFCGCYQRPGDTESQEVMNNNGPEQSSSSSTESTTCSGPFFSSAGGLLFELLSRRAGEMSELLRHASTRSEGHPRGFSYRNVEDVLSQCASKHGFLRLRLGPGDTLRTSIACRRRCFLSTGGFRPVDVAQRCRHLRCS